jgi:hypothetical protein
VEQVPHTACTWVRQAHYLHKAKRHVTRCKAIKAK